MIGRRPGSGGPRVLLVGHTDTVFDDGTAAERPFRIEGSRARGPGVSDMKAGLLTGFFAMHALQDAGARGVRARHLRVQPRRGDRLAVLRARRSGSWRWRTTSAFVLEGARANGDIVSARKGTTDYDAHRARPRGARRRGAREGAQRDRGGGAR